MPRVSEIGGDGALAIAAASVDKAAKPAELEVTVRGPANASLFVEGGADWYLPPPMAAGPGRYRVRLEGLPKSATLAGRTLRLTHVGPDGAVEALYTLP